MDREQFDYIVIGGGSAGYAAARTARENNKRVAIIDAASELGGLCILRGCMPSKTLLYSAEILHQSQRGDLFGLKIETARANMAAIHARKTRIINEFKEYRQEQLQSDRFTLIREHAHFIDKKTIELKPSGRRLTAEHFIIATGSVVNWPDIPGLEPAKTWTSDDILELDFLPTSVTVLGGGIVACELAQFLQRIGAQVTLIQRSPHILKECSPEASEVVLQALRDEGMTIYTGTSLQSIDYRNDSNCVHFKHNGALVSVESAHLFNALGRRPAIDHLGLDAAGIEVQSNGQIVTNAYQQTSNPRIYAAGDVAGPHEIVHLAIMQGEVAAKHACGQRVSPVNYEARTGIVFTDPQIATAGISIAEAIEKGLDLEIADYPFDDHGKSILMEAKYGYVKAWADRQTGTILGAECVGKDAGELIHAMAVAIALRAKASDLLRTHWYHPTLSEIWSYPIEDIVDALS